MIRIQERHSPTLPSDEEIFDSGGFNGEGRTKLLGPWRALFEPESVFLGVSFPESVRPYNAESFIVTICSVSSYVQPYGSQPRIGLGGKW